MFNNPFSFEGRIRRSEFGLSFIIFIFARAIIVFVTAALMYNKDNTFDSFLIALLLTILPIWFLWAQGSKRCHDLGNSGWFQLIPFYFFWMLFADGEPGANSYGENPKDLQNNYINSTTNKLHNKNSVNNIQSNQSGYQGNYQGGHNSINQRTSNNSNRDSKGYQDGSLYN